MANEPHPASPVRIVDIQMPFASMVGFMVKWTIAAIPALFILFFLFLLGAMLYGALMR